METELEVEKHVNTQNTASVYFILSHGNSSLGGVYVNNKKMFRP